MELAPMRYKDYVWPHNPRAYFIEYQRSMGVHKVPFGRYHLQDLGPTRRVMKGEGEFVGDGAYQEFQKLAAVFYSDGPGVLVHPVWQATQAYFVALTLQQEPRENYVRYTFAFWETYQGYDAYARTASGAGAAGTGVTKAVAEGKKTWHTVAQGESLWKIAQNYGVGLAELIARNPQIKNPNLICAGEKVRVQ